MSSHYQKAYFLLSVADVKQLPPDQGIEVALVGRSNAGKSSVLNRITRSKNLARVSKTPGRTQMINIFVLDDERRIADLPGYGYAKVPLAAKHKWQKLVDSYIRTRESLKGLILVMDIRHIFKELDRQLLAYCDERDLPVHILFNKADKLSKGTVANMLPTIKNELAEYRNLITFQIFSALKGTGVKELHELLDEWYQPRSPRIDSIAES
jgi:GTP-binding protein